MTTVFLRVTVIDPTPLSLFAHTHTHTLTPPPPSDCDAGLPVCDEATCLSMRARILLIHLGIYSSAHFYYFFYVYNPRFWSRRTRRNEMPGFFLTRLISCRRRHRLIKIIPCYRGCFGQPNDIGGPLCSTGCSRSANRSSLPN